MALAANRLPNLRVDTSAYRMRSTARFIGPMEADGQIREDRVLFREMDLDGPRSGDTAQITMHTPIHLGFRQLPHQRWTATPLYRIEKHPRLRQRQGMYALVGMNGQVLKRGHDLAAVLRVLERKLIRLV